MKGEWETSGTEHGFPPKATRLTHQCAFNGNWRVIFRFVGQDVELVDYLD